MFPLFWFWRTRYEWIFIEIELKSLSCRSKAKNLKFINANLIGEKFNTYHYSSLFHYFQISVCSSLAQSYLRRKWHKIDPSYFWCIIVHGALDPLWMCIYPPSITEIKKILHAQFGRHKRFHGDSNACKPLPARENTISYHGVGIIFFWFSELISTHINAVEFSCVHMDELMRGYQLHHHRLVMPPWATPHFVLPLGWRSSKIALAALCINDSPIIVPISKRPSLPAR